MIGMLAADERVKMDSDYYYYDQSVFRPDFMNMDSLEALPNTYIDNLPYWWVQKHNLPGDCPNVRINTSCHPGFIDQTVSKNTSVRGKEYASLTISYQDVNSVNSSNSETVTINIVIEKRFCPNNIKGIWTMTYDAQGAECYRFNNSSGVLPPSYIKSESVNMKANSSTKLKLDTNLILHDSNIAIIPEDTSNSLVSLSLDNEKNTFLIKTGGKQINWGVFKEKYFDYCVNSVNPEQEIIDFMETHYYEDDDVDNLDTIDVLRDFLNDKYKLFYNEFPKLAEEMVTGGSQINWGIFKAKYSEYIEKYIKNNLINPEQEFIDFMETYYYDEELENLNKIIALKDFFYQKYQFFYKKEPEIAEEMVMTVINTFTIIYYEYNKETVSGKITVIYN